MKKRIIGFLIAAVLVSAIAAVSLFYRRDAALPDNPVSYSGNTGANLYNRGLFVEFEGRIYFANNYDNGYIYSMNSDLTDIKKLYEDSAEYLNIDSAGKYLYYSRINYRNTHSSAQVFDFSSSGIYRLRTNGKNLARLYDDSCGTVLLAGNSLCVQLHGEDGDFDCMRMDLTGKNTVRLTSENITPVDYYRGSLFFTGTGSDHSLYETPLSSYAPSLVAQINGYMPVAAADGIYYISQADGYKLHRLSYPDYSDTVVVSERICTFNISNDGVFLFYQVDDGKQNRICSYNQITGMEQTILDGDYKNLNVTGRYLFFETFDSSAMYCYTISNGSVKRFRPTAEK